MNFLSHAQWLHIAVATVAYFAIGAIWYSALFGKIWAAEHNIVMTEQTKAAAKKKMPMMMVVNLLITFGMCIATAFVVSRLASPTCVTGIKLGLFISGSYVASTFAINYMYTGKSLKVWVIDAAYHVVGITLACIIYSVWH